MLPCGQIKHRDTVRAGFLRLFARVPFVVRVPTLPQFHLRAGERRTVQGVAEISQRLLAGGFQNQRRVGDEDQFPRALATGLCFQHVSAGLEFGVEVEGVVAGLVVVGFPLTRLRQPLPIGWGEGRVRDMCPRLELLQFGDINGPEPILALFTELHIAIEFDRIKRQLDLLHIAPIQVVLDFRIGQEDVAHANAELRLGDVLDLRLRRLPIVRLAFGELGYETTEKLERLRKIRLLPPVPVSQRHRPTLAGHPLGVVVERVVIPLRRLSRLERALEFLGHAGPTLPISALIANRHGDEIMRVGQIVFGLRDFQHIVEHVERDVISPIAVAEFALHPRRRDHAPHQREIALAGEF